MSSHPVRLVSILETAESVLGQWSCATLVSAGDARTAVGRSAAITLEVTALATRLERRCEDTTAQATSLVGDVERWAQATETALQRTSRAEVRSRALAMRAMHVLAAEEARLTAARAARDSAEHEKARADAELVTARAEEAAAAGDVRAAESALSACRASGYYDHQAKRTVQPDCSGHAARVSAARGRLSSAQAEVQRAAGRVEVARAALDAARAEVVRCVQRVERAQQAGFLAQAAVGEASRAAGLAAQASVAQRDAARLGDDAVDAAAAAATQSEVTRGLAARVVEVGDELLRQARALRDASDRQSDMARLAQDALTRIGDQLRAFDHPVSF